MKSQIKKPGLAKINYILNSLNMLAYFFIASLLVGLYNVITTHFLIDEKYQQIP